MGVVGERWSLLIVRELLLGPRRFGEIRAALTGLSANVLAQRLEGLEAAGVLRRHLLPSPANVTVFELTRWGAAAEDAILALGRWAAGSPAHDLALPLSGTAFMLMLKALMRPAPGALIGLDVGFRAGGDSFRGTVGDRLTVRRAETAGAPIVFGGQPSALAATFFGGESLVRSQLMGRVAMAGDLRTAQAFIDLFGLPEFPAR
jgi:DNA-binding HxlR family transcriptional regulator